MLSFEWLLDPVSADTFLKDYYEKQPLLIEGGDPDKFKSVLTIEEIDRYLSTSSPCYPDIFLVDAARDLRVEQYAFPNGSPPGRLDLPRVYELFQSGATISISQLNDRLPGLGALCRAVERYTSHPFQTNIYLTPPNAQGFKTHYDTHDVFVLQVSGTKHWTLNESPVELPLHGQHYDSQAHAAGAVTRELTMRAGDMLYCPRGLCHSARATGDTSLHITLGMIGRTWADLMVEAVAEACLSSPAFRANLPIGFARAGFDRSQVLATFRSLAEGFARNIDPEAIFDRFAEEFIASRRPALTGCLQEIASAPEVSGETKAVVRPDFLYRLQEEGDKLAIVFGSTRITLPLHTRTAVEAALGGAPFVVRNLPGPLDEAGKIVLVRRLIKDGLLTRVGDGAFAPGGPRAAERANGAARPARAGLRGAAREP
jgi:ribosomal protein L16 Arg81 hydroxylase